jgi:hypothetical protein
MISLLLQEERGCIHLARVRFPSVRCAETRTDCRYRILPSAVAQESLAGLVAETISHLINRERGPRALELALGLGD